MTIDRRSFPNLRKSTDWGIGDTVKFLDCGIMRSGVVVGYDTHDRLLCDYVIREVDAVTKGPVHAHNASIHINLILGTYTSDEEI